MAEYIDRNLIKWYGCNFENASCENRECSGCSHAECSHTQVMQIPTADVVERSKIDKAIEEMKMEVYCDNGFSQGVQRAIEILKRNIGEDKENE